MIHEWKGYLLYMYTQKEMERKILGKRKNYLVIIETYYFPVSLEKIEFMDREGDRSKALPRC